MVIYDFFILLSSLLLVLTGCSDKAHQGNAELIKQSQTHFHTGTHDAQSSRVEICNELFNNLKLAYENCLAQIKIAMDSNGLNAQSQLKDLIDELRKNNSFSKTAATIKDEAGSCNFCAESMKVMTHRYAKIESDTIALLAKFEAARSSLDHAKTDLGWLASEGQQARALMTKIHQNIASLKEDFTSCTDALKKSDSNIKIENIESLPISRREPIKEAPKDNKALEAEKWQKQIDAFKTQYETNEVKPIDDILQLLSSKHNDKTVIETFEHFNKLLDKFMAVNNEKMIEKITSDLSKFETNNYTSKIIEKYNQEREIKALKEAILQGSKFHQELIASTQLSLRIDESPLLNLLKVDKTKLKRISSEQSRELSDYFKYSTLSELKALLFVVGEKYDEFTDSMKEFVTNLLAHITERENNNKENGSPLSRHGKESYKTRLKSDLEKLFEINHNDRASEITTHYESFFTALAQEKNLENIAQTSPVVYLMLWSDEKLKNATRDQITRLKNYDVFTTTNHLKAVVYKMTKAGNLDNNDVPIQRYCHYLFEKIKERESSGHDGKPGDPKDIEIKLFQQQYLASFKNDFGQ